MFMQRHQFILLDYFQPGVVVLPKMETSVSQFVIKGSDHFTTARGLCIFNLNSDVV